MPPILGDPECCNPSGRLDRIHGIVFSTHVNLIDCRIYHRESAMPSLSESTTSWEAYNSSIDSEGYSVKRSLDTGSE
jgi:hypothetical protein